MVRMEIYLVILIRRFKVIKIESDYLFEMSNYGNRTTGENFTVWVDCAGALKNIQHNDMRIKFSANDTEVCLIVDNNDNIRRLNPDNKSWNKFKYGKQAELFTQKFLIPLRMQWKGEIDSAELGTIFKNVNIKGFTVEDAINQIL